MVTFFKSFFVYPFNCVTTLQSVVSNCGLGLQKTCRFFLKCPEKSNQLNKKIKKVHGNKQKEGIEEEEKPMGPRDRNFLGPNSIENLLENSVKN